MRIASIHRMKLDEVMTELAAKGSAATKRTHMNHGAPEPLFGVKISDLKFIQKRIKGDQALALALYDTGNADAQYLAGMVADGKKMTPGQLQKWAETASWGMISEYTVSWIASEHPDGFEFALKWIDSPKEDVACSGWTTLAALAAIVPDDRLPVKQFSALLDRVAKTLKTSPNCVHAFDSLSPVTAAQSCDSPLCVLRDGGRPTLPFQEPPGIWLPAAR